MLFDVIWTFAKIGLFGFGGGYAMIPLIQVEIEKHGWLTIAEFADIIAVSQMTPGPIGVNAATFIGMRTGGITGAVAATFGLVLPSCILVILAAHMVQKFKTNRYLEAVLQGIRPAAIGLVATAVMFFASLSVFSGNPRNGELSLDVIGVIIFITIILLTKICKIHPIAAVLLSGLLGVVGYAVL